MITFRWSVIASHLEGRTDNDVKNYWNTKMKKKLLASKSGIGVPYNNFNGEFIDFSSDQNTEFSICPNGQKSNVEEHENITLSSFQEHTNAGASWAENGGTELLFGLGSGSGSGSCPANDDLLDGFDFLEEIINSSDEMDSSLGNKQFFTGQAPTR